MRWQFEGRWARPLKKEAAGRRSAAAAGPAGISRRQVSAYLLGRFILQVVFSVRSATLTQPLVCQPMPKFLSA